MIIFWRAQMADILTSKEARPANSFLSPPLAWELTATADPTLKKYGGSVAV
jgi:hypothetical protein